jgi:hypothetical protein
VNECHMPTIEELDGAPELAVLAALDSTLEAAARSLMAAYPELGQDDVPRYRIEPVIRVSQLLAHASRLQVALARYREAVLRENA